jgi:hypothetical protein
MKTGVLVGCGLLASIIAVASVANAASNQVCTKTKGSSVALRTGAGGSFPRGLVMVGSGGKAVDQFFRKKNYTIADGEQVSVFSSSRGADGRTWRKVGTNQWVAWVREDFICQRP